MADPIDPKVKAVATDLGEMLYSILKKAVGNRMGYVLLIFDFGKNGRMNYISNANRGDVIRTLKELVVNLENDVEN